MSDAAIFNSNWIKAPEYTENAGLTFSKSFVLKKKLKKAEIQVTALGVYYVTVNGNRIKKDVLTPGWTDNYNRLQYQTYGLTTVLEQENNIEIHAGQGWRFMKWPDENDVDLAPGQLGVLAAIRLCYEDGSEESVMTDDSWLVCENEVTYNNIYNGETQDFNRTPQAPVNAVVFQHTKNILIPQEGEFVREQETFSGQKLIVTPKGETVIDFGQELTGYISFRFTGHQGKAITVRHFEVLDRDGNVYTENLRSAKQTFTVIGDGNTHTVKPQFTFYGFRYIAVEGMTVKNPALFKAIVIHSEMKRTGYFECSDELLNQLFHNIIWGQKGNFVDVPTDCPQRDERLGWTGDAQVFCKTASYNFNTLKFFSKWLGDMRSCQNKDGIIPHIVPCRKGEGGGSAAWADVACVLPWQMYLTYGNKSILRQNYAMMKKWVNCMAKMAAKKRVKKDFTGSRNPYLHNNGWHFGDWLAMDKEDKEDVWGATDHNYIGTAFFAYSTSILIKAGKVLGRDTVPYEALYSHILEAFNSEYVNADGTLKCNTQTACLLALRFELVPNRKPVAEQLLRLLDSFGYSTTGFVGTPYMLSTLSSLGETKRAYDLLLRTEWPSWLYQVKNGATTMWERWNGIKPDGTFANKDMNSFNHYAYGAVGSWMYEHMAGIRQAEDSCGFDSIVFAPETDDRLSYVKASIDTVHGTVASEWKTEHNSTVYTFTVPTGVKAKAVLAGKTYELTSGINTIKCY